ALADQGDPPAAFAMRWQFAERLPKPDYREAMIALARERDHALLPSRNGSFAFALGQLCDELGDLFEAEAWLWQAVRDAHWHGDTRTENNAFAQIGTLRMRRGDAATAAPILARVGEAFRGSKSQEAWALRQQGNVELVRSNFAKAEELYRK